MFKNSVHKSEGDVLVKGIELIISKDKIETLYCDKYFHYCKEYIKDMITKDKLYDLIKNKMNENQSDNNIWTQFLDLLFIKGEI